MNIGDTILTKIDKSLGDEFEAQTFHKSSTVALNVAPTLILIMGAIQGWVLPGYYALWCLLVLIPLAGLNGIQEQWMRSRIARPAYKLKDNFWGLLAVNLALVIAMLSGIAYNIQENSPMYIWTALVGAGFALLVTPIATKARRDRDEKRLDAQLED